MQLYISLTLYSILSHFYTVFSVQMSLFTSMQCNGFNNTYENLFTCNVSNSNTITRITYCYRVCRDTHISGRSMPCEAFAINVTSEGTSQCYLCDRQSTGQYLLSDMTSAQRFVNEKVWPLLYWAFDGNSDELSYSLYNGATLTTGWVRTVVRILYLITCHKLHSKDVKYYIYAD